MAGWGNVLGKLFDYVQGREERRRNQLDALKKERDEILRKPQDDKSTRRLERILKRISLLERYDKNK